MVTLLPPGVLPVLLSPGPPVFPGEEELLSEPVVGEAVVFPPEGVAPPDWRTTWML